MDRRIHAGDLAHRSDRLTLLSWRQRILRNIVDLHVSRVDILQIAHLDAQFLAVLFDFIETGRSRSRALGQGARADHSNRPFGGLLHDIERIVDVT